MTPECILLYSLQVARRKGQLKKTAPTTVRFLQELHEFVKEEAESHRDGQSGVINDAVAFYKEHVEQQRRALREAI